jgi:hypothetical protein
MQEFAKKHLKPLENNSTIIKTIDMAIKEAQTAAKQTIEKEIQESIGILKQIGYGSAKSFEFNPEFKQKLNTAINAELESHKMKIIRDAQEAMLEKEAEIKITIEERLNRRMEKFEEDLENKMKSHFEGLLQKFLLTGIGA